MPFHEDHFSSKSKTDLVEIINRLETYNKCKSIENTVFQRYLIKMDPTSLEIVNGEVQLSDKMDAGYASTISGLTSPSRFLSKSKSSFGLTATQMRHSNLKISSQFKLDLVEQALQWENEQTDKDIEKCEDEKQSHLSKIEEMQIRKNEIKNTKVLLNQLVENYANPITKRITGLKLIRFIEKNIKETDNKIQKCYLLKIKFNRRLKEIKERSPADINNESLKLTDFDRIRIVNKQLKQSIDEKEEMLNIKRRDLSIISDSLILHKEFLRQQKLQFKMIKQKIVDTQKRIKELERQQCYVNIQIKHAEKAYNKIMSLKNLLPSNMNTSEYARKCAELRELRLSIKHGNRRLQAQNSRMLLMRRKLLKQKYNRKLARIKLTNEW